MTSTRTALLRALLEPARVDDPDQVDPELVRGLAPWLDRACRAYFRLEVRGIERVPPGAALVVGNHNSGASFVEAIGVGARFLRERPDESWNGLAHDKIVELPVLGKLLARIGAVRAGHDTAAAAFARGRKVVVFPGGNAEAFRPYRDRHRIAFEGRTGWLKLALRHRVPVVPMVNIGGHEGFVVLRDGRRLARAIGADRWMRSDTWPLIVGLPWGVTLGPVFHLPLPVKCVTEFLPPVHLGEPPEAADDPAVLRRLYDDVTGRMQAALDALAAERARTGRF
ncbi:MAG TPA: 1-acyl-sn-glycerol-3-phosphate acyltransferase [Gemmatimonadaceae bacterium]|nr:1-acyl-sn-glycerol-3-phosphate acyltransferase [Gemmatimonadaceae bacterium]